MKRLIALGAGCVVLFSACVLPVFAGQDRGVSETSRYQEELCTFDDIHEMSNYSGLIELPGGETYEVLYKRSDGSGFAAKSTPHGGMYYINMKEGYQLSYEFLVYDGETERLIDGGVFEPLYYQVQVENAKSPSEAFRYRKNNSQAEKILYDLPQNDSYSLGHPTIHAFTGGRELREKVYQGKNGEKVRVQRTIKVTSLQTGEESRHEEPPVYVEALGDAKSLDAFTYPYKMGEEGYPGAEDCFPSAGVIYTYKVKKGDCLWKIAEKELGRAQDWNLIYKINKDKIKDPDRIYEGQFLDLPLE